MLVIPTQEQVPAFVGGLVGAVGGDAGLLPTQTATLTAIGRVLDIDAVGPVEALDPADTAAAVTDPELRRELVRTMVLLAFLEHPPAEARLASIRRYARALDVTDDSVRIFGDYAKEHTHRMLLDTFRSLPFVEWERAYAREEGFATVARSALAVLNRGESPKLTAKFRALEDCPDGSLGQKLVAMYHEHQWPWPGERHSVPEATTVHDWVHVLAGYAPTPQGEIQVAAFIAAGSPNPAMFGLLMLTFGLYEAGAFRLPQFPHAPEGHVMEQPGVPEGLADALRRGAATNVDLMEGVDHWALANDPVAELRARFDVVPKDEPNPTADPGA